MTQEQIDLSMYEKRIFSQKGDDGIILKLVGAMPLAVSNKFFVEIGTGDGRECNSRNLRENHGWTGVMLDGRYSNPTLNLYKVFLTRENVVEILRGLHVPSEFGFLSVDIDMNTFYILAAVLSSFAPAIVDVEYNCELPPDKDMVVEYKADGVWDHTKYFGGSILAYYNLCRRYGYSLVYTDKEGVNAFFVRDEGYDSVEFKDRNDVVKVYHDISGRESRRSGRRGYRKDRLGRAYITSEQAIRLG